MASGAGASGIPAATLTQLALLYYRDGLTQGEIAARVGLSRATVINYLRLARDSGVVEIRINGDGFATSRLSRDLAARWDLTAAYLAPTPGPEHPTLSTLAQVAAIAVADLLTPEARLGLAWGETVQAVAEAFPLRAMTGLTVHQMVGSMHGERLFAAESCAFEIARKCQADCRTLHAPAVLSSAALAQALRAEPVIRDQLRQFDRLSHALFSVGSLGPRTTLVTSGISTAGEVAAYAEAGAAAVLCGHFIDAEGRAMATPLGDRMIGITAEQLARVPTRILVAAGEDKLDAIRALLKGGYVSHLMTDESSAKTLLA